MFRSMIFTESETDRVRSGVQDARRRGPGGTRGFTLLEALVVVFLVGIMAFIAGRGLTGARERSGLRSEAQEVQAFLEGAQVEARRRGQTVRIEWDGTNRRVRMGTVAGGTLTVTDTNRVADGLILRNGSGADWPTLSGVPTLDCDPFGRALDPNTGTQLQGPVTFEMTAQAMLSGDVQPLTVYTVQVFPVWKVRLVKEIQ